MNSKQDDSGSAQLAPSPHGELPEVSIESEQNSSLVFGTVQQPHIRGTRKIGTGPKQIMIFLAKLIDYRLRKILVGEEPHC
jgi:hypothetical protein